MKYGVEPIPAVIGWEAGYTLDKSPVHHRTTQRQTRQTTTHTFTLTPKDSFIQTIIKQIMCIVYPVWWCDWSSSDNLRKSKKSQESCVNETYKFRSNQATRTQYCIWPGQWLGLTRYAPGISLTFTLYQRGWKGSSFPNSASSWTTSILSCFEVLCGC